MNKIVEEHDLCISIISVLEKDLNNIKSIDGVFLLKKEYKNLVFNLDYPNRKKVKVKIEKAKTIADILVPIAEVYNNKIYTNPNKYGVNFHGIQDLVFEILDIVENGTSYIGIGS